MDPIVWSTGFLSYYLILCAEVFLAIDFILHSDVEKLERERNEFVGYGYIRNSRGLEATPQRLNFPAFRHKEAYITAPIAAYHVAFGVPNIFCRALFLISAATLLYTAVKQVLETMDEQRCNEGIWGIYYGWSKVINIELLETHKMALSEELQSWKDAWLQVRQEELPFLAAEDGHGKVD